MLLWFRDVRGACRDRVRVDRRRAGGVVAVGTWRVGDGAGRPDDAKPPAEACRVSGCSSGGCARATSWPARSNTAAAPGAALRHGPCWSWPIRSGCPATAPRNRSGCGPTTRPRPAPASNGPRTPSRAVPAIHSSVAPWPDLSPPGCAGRGDLYSPTPERGRMQR